MEPAGDATHRLSRQPAEIKGAGRTGKRTPGHSESVHNASDENRDNNNNGAGHGGARL